MDGDETLAEQTSAQERRWSWKGTRRWTGPWHRRPRSWRLRTAVLPVVAALSLSGSIWLLLSGAGLPKTTVRPAVLPGVVVAPKPPPPTGSASSQPRTGLVPPSSDETASSAPTTEPLRLGGEQIPPGSPVPSPSPDTPSSPPAVAPPPLPPPVPVMTSTPPVCPPLPPTKHGKPSKPPKASPSTHW